MSAEKPQDQTADGAASHTVPAAQAQTGDAEKKASDQPAASTGPKKGPAGGYDATPIAHAPPGYTVKITFHRATRLPIADLSTLSSDPYLTAQLTTDLPPRHKEDPPMRFRSRTIWENTEPEWEEEWIVAHVPATGFEVKVRIYDEDSSDHDDRLGNVHVKVGRIDENWEGIRDQPYKILKKSGSWRAYFFRAMAVCMSKAEEMSGKLYVSVEVLGRTPGTEGGRTYTIGPNYWCKNYSPILGRIVGSKTTTENQEEGSQGAENTTSRKSQGPKGVGELKQQMSNRGKLTTKQHNSAVKRKPHRYNFESNQMQLTGPVPPDLYHRYVEFRPFIKALFTAKGIRGVLLHKALHHQHVHVYNYNRETEYGVFPSPSAEMTHKFLDLVHWDEGGRMFTYVITLDALMRFTETGKEFGIDLLSKHTMHSDASIYIAYSGEFFIRRVKNPKLPTHEELATVTSPHPSSDPSSTAISPTHPPDPVPAGPPRSPGPRDPSYYELLIDNDSGTYRPNGKLLPQLRQFLSSNFPGLRVVTLDAVRDADLMARLKAEQRERKRNEGRRIVFTQAHSPSSSSVSSADLERLDELAEQEDREAQRNRVLEQQGGGAAGPLPKEDTLVVPP